MSTAIQAACLLGILATAACNGSRSAKMAGPTGLRAGVHSAADRLLTALRANDADSFMVLLSNDVVLMPPSELRLKGKARFGLGTTSWSGGAARRQCWRRNPWTWSLGLRRCGQSSPNDRAASGGSCHLRGPGVGYRRAHWARVSALGHGTLESRSGIRRGPRPNPRMQPTGRGGLGLRSG